jgi:sugar O-acyltransferase (sialic acid O-acetyltransferase NeuD family)
VNSPVIILGTGGHAKVLIDALRRQSVAILGATDIDPGKAGQLFFGVRILGSDEVVAQYTSSVICLVNGVGSARSVVLRKELFLRFKNRGNSFANVVHPSAVIASDASLDEGAQIMAGAVLQAGCRIGANVIVNTRVAVDHDCHVGEHVHLAPGVTLSGGVVIGSDTHVGVGATIIQGIRIGSGCLIAAGAVVVRDVPDGATVMGVPARETNR